MPTYFTRPVLGTLQRRYYCGELDRRGVFHVDQVLGSRPDGTEIPEPPAVQIHTSTAREQLARSLQLATAAARVATGGAEPMHRRQQFTVATRTGDWRRCAVCEQQKPLSDYYAVPSKSVGTRSTVCKACTDAGRTFARRGRRAADQPVTESDDE